MTFASPHKRGQQGDLATIESFENIIDDLVFAPAHHFFACIVRIGFRSPGKQEAEKIVYFGDGPNGGPGVFVSGFLLDRNNGRKPCDLIYVGSFHFTDKLAGIGAKGFHIPPLSFGIDRIEGQG
jgi:hypothetical protein